VRSNRFMADIRPDSPDDPILVNDLIDLLGIEGKDHDIQKSLIWSWLSHNNPNPVLLVDLEDKGIISDAKKFAAAYKGLI